MDGQIGRSWMVEKVAKCDRFDGLNGRISAGNPVMARVEAKEADLSQNTTHSHFMTV